MSSLVFQLCVLVYLGVSTLKKSASLVAIAKLDHGDPYRTADCMSTIWFHLMLNLLSLLAHPEWIVQYH
jgi:hypothetical protein